MGEGERGRDAKSIICLTCKPIVSYSFKFNSDYNRVSKKKYMSPTNEGKNHYIQIRSVAIFFRITYFCFLCSHFINHVACKINSKDKKKLL